MSEGLTRLKDVSHRIADELDEHNRLLDDLDEDASNREKDVFTGRRECVPLECLELSSWKAILDSA